MAKLSCELAKALGAQDAPSYLQKRAITGGTCLFTTRLARGRTYYAAMDVGNHFLATKAIDIGTRQNIANREDCLEKVGLMRPNRKVIRG